MTPSLIVSALCLLLVGTLVGVRAVRAARERHWLGGTIRGLVALLLLALAALAATLTVGLHGYRALSFEEVAATVRDRKSTRLNSSHLGISYAVFCLKLGRPPTSSLFPYTTLFRSLVGTLVGVRAVRAARERHWLGGTIRGLVALLLLALAALAATLTVGLHGYRALSFEEVAATVRTEPVAPQRFRATITLPDHRLAMYELAGDAFYMDAHILKWHPWANLLGLHTVYELDRVAGRYNAVGDERTQPHTAYELARSKPVDLYSIARRRLLGPLVDAEYGSATFVAATRPATFEVRVSTTGLLARPVPSRPTP